MLLIRKAKKSDIRALKELYVKVCRSTFFRRPQEEFQLADYTRVTQGELVWVAEEDNLIKGFVSVNINNSHLHNLFVLDDFHQQGIGSKLLQEGEKCLRLPMFLRVAYDNIKACSFYKKRGWISISFIKDVEKPYFLYKKL